MLTPICFLKRQKNQTTINENEEILALKIAY
jgi:hypothetical protein